MQVHYTAEIVKNLRKLVRRYRHIEDDLQSLIDQLQAGDTPGDQVTGTGYPVYKVRVKNRDISIGSADQIMTRASLVKNRHFFVRKLANSGLLAAFPASN